MGFLDKLKLAWDGAGTVAEAIASWRPGRCRTEKDYENSLYAYLHKRFPDFQITKQYARGRVRADIAVEEKVILELKHNLDSTSKFQRLVGQIADYKDWPGQVIILLTGDTDPNLLKELHRHLEREGLTAADYGNISIVEK